MNTQPQQTQKPEPPQPSQEQPQYRFRTVLYLGIPLAIGILWWLISGIVPSFSFEGLMEQLNVTMPERYVRLTCLGILLITILLIIKHSKSKP